MAKIGVSSNLQYFSGECSCCKYWQKSINIAGLKTGGYCTKHYCKKNSNKRKDKYGRTY